MSIFEGILCDVFVFFKLRCHKSKNDIDIYFLQDSRYNVNFHILNKHDEWEVISIIFQHNFL